MPRGAQRSAEGHRGVQSTDGYSVQSAEYIAQTTAQSTERSTLYWNTAQYSVQYLLLGTHLIMAQSVSACLANVCNRFVLQRAALVMHRSPC